MPGQLLQKLNVFSVAATPAVESDAEIASFS
jgi:hypothetical protein